MKQKFSPPIDISPYQKRPVVSGLRLGDYLQEVEARARADQEAEARLVEAMIAHYEKAQFDELLVAYAGAAGPDEHAAEKWEEI